MLKSIPVVVALTFTTVASAAYNHRPAVRSLEHTVKFGSRADLAKKTERTIEAILKLGARQLRNKGFRAESTQMLTEWNTTWSTALERQVSLEALGDHAPLSNWLMEQYFTLVILLGPELCETLHLDDINIVNFAIPVVFHMALIGDDPIDLAEYRVHFEPFGGVLGFWGTWIGCEILTWGGGLFWICSPAGMAAEYLVVTYVAPRLSPHAYARFYD